jgi:WD40 repeat protein
VVDHSEESCYVGSHEGKIYRLDLLDPPRSVEQMVDESASRKMFVGHEKAVTCLSVSTGGCHLLSGEDKKKTISVNDYFFKKSLSQQHIFPFLCKKKKKQVRMTVALGYGT